jgi:hypothetical protein
MTKSPFVRSAFNRELPSYPNVIDGNLMDGLGSLQARAHKLMRLQRLGVVDKKFDFPKMLQQPAAFDLSERTVLCDAQVKSQGKGFMVRHVVGNDPRMQEVTYSGDPAVCWDQFKAPGFVGTINTNVDTREETVRLRPGQRVQIVG